MGNDYFCINKCLAQQLHCLWIVLRCLWYKNIEKQLIIEIIAFSNKLDPNFKTWSYLHISFIFSYLGTRFRNFAFNLEPTPVQIMQFDQDAGSRGIYSVKVFWEVYVSLLIAFAQSKYGTNKFLDMTFEKVWKRQVS